MIQLIEVTKTYTKGRLAVHALCGVTLRIPDRDFLCIQRPSGSGRTTLLHLIGLLDHPTSGTIRLFGQDVSALSRRDRARLRRDARHPSRNIAWESPAPHAWQVHTFPPTMGTR